MTNTTLNNILSSVAENQQIARQIANGDKTVTVYLIFTKGQKGRKINIEKTRFTDLTLCKKSEEQFLQEELGKKTIEENPNLVGQLESMTGDIILAEIGYYEPEKFRYFTTPKLMTRAEFNATYNK